MERECLVSVIIPAYNVEKYIDECINSVLNQTYKNIEVICVDDHSQDETVENIERLKKKDNRIKLLLNENTRGPAYSRNKGLESAAGEYIYFLDSDDYILENAIETLVSLANEYKTECIFFDSYQKLESKMLGTTNLEYGLKNIDKKVMIGKKIFAIMMDNNVFSGAVWRQFWQKDYLLDNEIRFDDRLSSAEDTPFTVHAILQGTRMMILNKKFHIYRRHEGTLVSDVTFRKVKALFQTYCLLLQELLSDAYDRDIKIILEKKCQQLLLSARSIYIRNRFLVTETDFEDHFERHLFRYLIERKDDNLLYLDQVAIDKIRSYPKVIIYGDSYYSMNILYTMEQLDINVFGFAVTDTRRRGDNIAGIRLMRIEEYKEYSNEALIILGVKDKNNKKEIKKILNTYGFLDCLDLEV